MRRRAIILVLDGVGIGAAPDAASYGDAGSDTLGNVARAVRRARSPEPRSGWARQHRADRGRRARDVAAGRLGHDASRVGGQGQHDRPLGDRRPAPRAAVPDVSRRLSRTTLLDEFSRADGPRRSSATSPAAGRRSSTHSAPSTSDRRVDRVHVGRLRFSDRGARSGGSAGRALRGVRDRARDARGPARRFARDRAAVRRTAGRLRANGEPPRLLASRRRTRRCSTRSPPRACRAPGWGRWTTCSPAAASRRGTRASNAEGIAAILEWLGGRAGWVAVRQPCRFRPRCTGTGTMWRGSSARCASSTTLCRRSAPRFERTICCSSPPTTATIRRRARRITRASACRCWRSAQRSIRCRSGRADDVLGSWRDGGGMAERGVPGRGTSFLPELERGHDARNAVVPRGPSTEEWRALLTRAARRWSRRMRRIPSSASVRRCSGERNGR